MITCEKKASCLLFGLGHRNHTEEAGSKRHSGHRGWHGSAHGSTFHHSSPEVVMSQFGLSVNGFLASGKETQLIVSLLITENNNQ